MKKRHFLSILVSWFALLAGGSVLTAGSACGQQQQAIIRVTDSKSREPVAFAHVCFEGITHNSTKYALTSIEGTLPNTVTEPSRIVISYVGYATYNDTINPGESLEVKIKPTILNIDEVVITAQYAPERADKSIYKIDVINRMQIETRASTNLGDLLKSETNLKVQSNGVLGSSLKMQGLSGENIKILMDGVPMIGRMNGNFDLNQLQLYNVDHVEVIEGPMSVIYGSNALAGVINVITKENKSSAFSTTANAYYESVGQYNFAAAVSGSHKKHGFSVDGGRNFLDGYSYYDTSRVETFKPRRQYFFDGYYSYSDKILKMKFSGDYFNELLLDKGPLLPAYFETAFNHYFNTIRYSGRADFGLTFPRQHYVNGVFSYSAYERMKETYFLDLTTLQQNLSSTGEDRDTTGIHSYVARVTYARNDSARHFNYQTGIDVNVEDGTGKRIRGNRQEIGDYAAFLSLKWEPWQVLSIQPGIRFIYNTKYEAPLVYALSTRIGPFKGAGIRLSYARGFRAPDLKQLYLNFVDVNHNIQGNTDLKAEQSHNININLNYSVEKSKTAYTADITGFYNAIDNVILLASTGSSATSYQYINIDKYQTTGFQVSGTASLYPSLKLQAGLATTGVRGTIGTGQDPDEFRFSTDLTFNGSYRFVKQELTLSLFYKHTGSSTNISVEDEETSFYSIDPYNTMDVTAIKGFWMNRIRLSAGIKNIFDVKAVPQTGIVSGGHAGGNGAGNIGWGRTFFIGLGFTFNQYK